MKDKCAIERFCLSLSLAISAIVGSQMAVHAETTQAIPERPTLQMTDAASLPSHQVLSSAASFSQEAMSPQATTLLATALEPASQAAHQVVTQPLDAADSVQADTSVGTSAPTTTALAVPVPGTAPTAAADLDLQAVAPAPAEQSSAMQATAPTVAQIPPIEPGRATRSGPSYIGLGANIGAIGRTPLGDVSGAILSKIGLTRNFSVRPAVLINGDATFLLPITLDFPFESAGRVSFAPYVGVGASFSTGDRKNADLIVSGGVDVPLSPQFTLTASANAGLINGIELGVLVGIGYNFSGF
ncbi:MAG: hypothetical protein ACAF41_21985 [Leptolyngbya sp. BL-A-14]